mmetsp:Transcript_3046/g.4495  ORF Transcript_3046/g.4495 Transcript_3046/m.4495 type:complete len:202 (-) Transcript_3046:206-811(-)
MGGQSHLYLFFLCFSPGRPPPLAAWCEGVRRARCLWGSGAGGEAGHHHHPLHPLLLLLLHPPPSWLGGLAFSVAPLWWSPRRSPWRTWAWCLRPLYWLHSDPHPPVPRSGWWSGPAPPPQQQTGAGPAVGSCAGQGHHPLLYLGAPAVGHPPIWREEAAGPPASHWGPPADSLQTHAPPPGNRCPQTSPSSLSVWLQQPLL